MYKYEYLTRKAEECLQQVKEHRDELPLVCFYTNAAKGFIQRAARMTLAEAMEMLEEGEKRK